MSSYTDSTPLQFNPYLSQMPIIAERSDIAKEKQQNYNQGIQKIQGQIDNVGGLDVVRDVDKQYLQSKLNELGSKLKTVAAGDFSNFQLVNSVGGMANQIVKDSNVQNAVYSTANHRKQLALIEDARSKGQSAPDNEIDYQKQFGAYSSSKKLGEQFNGRYTPWIDVNKKLIEIGKEVGLDEKTVQSMWQTDENGKMKVDPKTGAPMWNPVMVEQHLKGKDPAKILNAFQNALTPADYNQLAITGRYIKGNTSPETLVREVATNYSGNISSVEGKLAGINISLAKNNNSQEVIDSLNKQKTFYQKQKYDLETAMDRDIKLVSTNPDAVKGNLYTNNYLSAMSKSLSSATEETTYKITPQFEVNMRLNEFNRNIQRDKISDQHWAIEQGRLDRKDVYEKDKDKLELWAKYGIGTPPPGYNIPSTGGMDEPIDLAKDKYAIVSSVMDNYSVGVNQLNAMNNNFTLDYFKLGNKKLEGEEDGPYAKRINKLISDYALSKGKDLRGDPNKINSFLSEFAAEKLTEWRKDKDSIPVEFKSFAKKQDELSKDLSAQQLKMERIKRDVLQQAKEQGLNTIDYNELKSKIKDLPITLPREFKGEDNKGRPIYSDSQQINLSKEDVIDFAKLHPGAHNTFGFITTDDSQKRNKEEARQKLSQKFGNKFEDIEKYLYKFSQFGVITSMNSEIAQVGKLLSNVNYSKLSELEADAYIKEGFIKQPKSFPLSRGKGDDKIVNDRLVEIISKYDKSTTPGFDKEKLIKTIDSGKEFNVKFVATPSLSRSQSPNYKMIVHDNSGNPFPLDITEQQFTYLTKVPGLVSKSEPIVMTNIKRYGTSGNNGSDSPEGAYFTNSDFVNVKSKDYKVTGNLVASKGMDDGMLYFKLYVESPDGSVKIIRYDEGIPKINPITGDFNETIDNVPKGITDETIKQLLKK